MRVVDLGSLRIAPLVASCDCDRHRHKDSDP